MATTHSLLIIERILRDRDGVWEQIGDQRDLGRLIRDLLFSSTLALFCFGAVLGAFNTDNAFLQALLSAVKLPLLFLVTLAICLPTLYLFNLVFGARLQVKQALALTGWDVADFLLGIPHTSSIAFGNPDKYLRAPAYDAYITDDWRVSPLLTLNAGARWEYADSRPCPQTHGDYPVRLRSPALTGSRRR